MRLDRDTENDIQLHVYKENLFHSSVLIPRENIEEGGVYRVKKRIAGHLDFVSWAVPYDDDNVHDIPAAIEEGELHPEVSICMHKQNDDDVYCEPMGRLFFGTSEYEETDLRTNSSCEIIIRDITCRVTVTVLGYDKSSVEQNTAPGWIELSGFKREVMLSMEPGGDDAMIASVLEFSEENEALVTGVLGLMPSAEEQYLQITAFNDERPMFTVKTEQRSIPGNVISLVVNRNQEVELYVNGWRDRNVTIEWI